MMPTNLAKKIRLSIANGTFDEEACAALEKLGTSSGVSIIEKLQNQSFSIQSAEQLQVFLMFAQRIAQTFGQEKIRPWYPIIKSNISSRSLEVSRLLVPLVRDMMTVDDAIRSQLFKLYFGPDMDENQNSILLEYGDAKPKDFFNSLDEYLIHEDQSIRYRAMQLICVISHRQGPNLHEFTNTNTFNHFLQILENSEASPDLMVVGLLALTMLLPCILRAIPPILKKLFAILKRVLCWDLSFPDGDGIVTLPATSFRNCVTYYFSHLYGMFPNNLLNFLRIEFQSGRENNDSTFSRATKPLLRNLRFNKFLLKYDIQSELSLGRWKSKESHWIVTHCMGERLNEQMENLYTTELASIDKGTLKRESYPQTLNEKENLTNEQIFALQTLLEHNLRLDQPLDPWSQDIPSHVLSSNVEDLRRQILALRNSLLFERYVRHQYIDRLASVHTDHANKLELKNNQQSLELQIKDLQKLKQDFEDLIIRKDEKIKDLNEQCKKLGELYVERLRSLTDEKSHLEQQNQDLIFQSKDKEEQVLELQMKYAHQVNQVFQLESRLADLSRQLVCSDLDHDHTEQAILWENLLRKSKTQKEILVSLRFSYAQQESLIKSLQTRLDETFEKLRICTTKLQEAMHTVRTLEKEKEEFENNQNQLKKQFEMQKNISKAKLKAQESKYSTIKTINIGLEHQILKLQSENSKLLHYLQNPDSLNGKQESFLQFV